MGVLKVSGPPSARKSPYDFFLGFTGAEVSILTTAGSVSLFVVSTGSGLSSVISSPPKAAAAVDENSTMNCGRCCVSVKDADGAFFAVAFIAIDGRENPSAQDVSNTTTVKRTIKAVVVVQ